MNKRHFFVLVSSCISCFSPCLAAIAWMDDVPEALIRAKAEDKALLLYRGKDRTTPRAKELREVFTGNVGFESYVSPRFILVDLSMYLDKNYPKGKAWRDDYDFGDELVVVSQDGVALGSLCGPYDDKGAYIPLHFSIVTEVLDRALLQKESIDELMEQAKQHDGVERASCLLKAYQAVEETRDFKNKYKNKPLMKAIIAADPDNQLNVFHELREKMAKARFHIAMTSEFNSLAPQQAYLRIGEMLQDPLYFDHKIDLLCYQFVSSDSVEDIRQVIKGALLVAETMADAQERENVLEVIHFIQSKDEQEVLQWIREERTKGPLLE